MSLANKTLSSTYADLLQLDNSNSGMATSLKNIKDGQANPSSVYISDDAVRIIPVNDDTQASLEVRATNGNNILVVDTTNELVKASGNNVNTQYATFAIGNVESGVFVADTHHPLPFASANYGNATTIPRFGTSTDPPTSFTTEESTRNRASDIVPLLWYVPDAISIDSVTSLEGADTATGDTTRMHLFSYDFTSGSTSALTNGTLLAHNSDVTNDGSEQIYKSTFTVDSAAVTAGKVILAFFRSDGTPNSDYSISITVKYHLT